MYLIIHEFKYPYHKVLPNIVVLIQWIYSMHKTINTTKMSEI